MLSLWSIDHRYQGKVDSTEVYPLTGAALWISFLNPDYHHHADGSLDTTEQQDSAEVFRAAVSIYNSQQNVNGAVNNTLNKATQKAYLRNPNVVGVIQGRSPHNLQVGT
jgi:hypothetical protein